MDPSLLIRLILLVVLIILSGFFSGSETAFFSISKHQVRGYETSRNLSRRWAYHLLKNPKNLIITLLIGNEFVNVAVTVTVTSLVLTFHENVYLPILISASLLLAFGETMPKTIGVNYPERFALLASVPLRIFSKLIKPLRRMIARIVDLIGRLFGFEPKDLGYTITEDEFRTLVDMGHDGGVLEVEEKELI